MQSIIFLNALISISIASEIILVCDFTTFQGICKFISDENNFESEIEAVLSGNNVKFDDKKSISISNCEISETFPRNLSNFLPNLESLRVTKTKLRTIKRNGFKGLENLKYLSLDTNKIDWMFPDAFNDLKNLESLFISNNKIDNLHSKIFHENLNLKGVWMDYNNIKELSAEIFKNNKKLEWLSFAHNKLKKIQINFRDLPKYFYGNFEKNFESCDLKFDGYLKNEREMEQNIIEFEQEIQKLCNN